MITIIYSPNSYDITVWKERMDRASLSYQFVIEDGAAVPRLVDGDTEAEGTAAIDAYLESQEQFVKGWYEDRCDKYDFDPDATPKIDGITG